jgi:hypothetical protein
MIAEKIDLPLASGAEFENTKRMSSQDIPHFPPVVHTMFRILLPIGHF